MRSREQVEALDEDNKMANPVNGQGKDGRKEGRVEEEKEGRIMET